MVILAQNATVIVKSLIRHKITNSLPALIHPSLLYYSVASIFYFIARRWGIHIVTWIKTKLFRLDIIFEWSLLFVHFSYRTYAQYKYPHSNPQKPHQTQYRFKKIKYLTMTNCNILGPFYSKNCKLWSVCTYFFNYTLLLINSLFML